MARSQGTVLSASDRNTIDFWTKEVKAATGHASIACIPLGASIAYIFAKTSKKIKILAVSMLLIIIGYNLVLSGRTLFIMMIICASIVYLYGLFFKKSNRVKSTVTIAAVIILVLLAYRSNLLGIRSYIESTPFYDRFFAEDAVMELEEDGRMERKLFYLENFWEYPWGGAHLRNFVGYSHDIYLDTYDEAGIFAFIAVFCYMLSTVFRLFKCITSKSIPFQTRQLVLCIYVCIYLEFMVEPILQGMPWLFASFCLIDGYVSRILKHNKIATENGVMVR
jgi:O-antigen ligase